MHNLPHPISILCLGPYLEVSICSQSYTLKKLFSTRSDFSQSPRSSPSVYPTLSSDKMTGSAFVGHPPSNQDDYWIIKGFLRLTGLPDKMIHPDKGLPIHKPPHASDNERGTGLLVAMCVAMALIIIITGTRLSLRYFRSDLKWGLDDWMLIPALVCS